MEKEELNFDKRVELYKKERDFICATLMDKYKLTETICLTKKGLTKFDKFLVKFINKRKIMVATIFYDIIK